MSFISKVCDCGNEFKFYEHLLKYGRGKYCSKQCAYKYRKLVPWSKGKKLGPMSEINRMKISKSLIGRPKPPFTESHRLHLSISRRKWKLSDFDIQKCRERALRESTGRYFPLMKGENHWHWNGGVSSLHSQIRSTGQYKHWRLSVYRRDWFRCVECGYRSHIRIHGLSDIHADHIISFSKIIEKYQIKSIKDALMCNELWDINNGRTLCYWCHRKHTFVKKEKSVEMVCESIQ